MNATALLLVVLSQQGYRVGGREQTISVSWIAREQMPASDLSWEVDFGPVRLAAGKERMSDPVAPVTIHVGIPAVRVRAVFKWTYRLVDRNSGKELETGDRSIQVFPANLTDDWPRRIGTNPDSGRPSTILVWDNGPIVEALRRAKVSFVRVSNLDGILGRPDMILLGPDMIVPSPFASDRLKRIAASGCKVAVFCQDKIGSVAGYPIRPCTVPKRVQIAAADPLFRGLSEQDVSDWFTGGADRRELDCVWLASDDSARKLVSWQSTSKEQRSLQSEALLIVSADGQLVVCQLPLDYLMEDPRSQIFMGNLLSFLAPSPLVLDAEWNPGVRLTPDRPQSEITGRARSCMLQN